VLREVSQTSSNRDYILKELYMCEGGLGHLYDTLFLWRSTQGTRNHFNNISIRPSVFYMEQKRKRTIHLSWIPRG